jgi:hypothetical protein
MWRDDPAAGATGQGSLHAARARVRARVRSLRRAAGDHHGNGELWVALPPRGELVAVPADAGTQGWVTTDVREGGAVGMTFGWTRGPGVEGPLEISGRRLDATAPPLGAEIQDYGPSGFQPSTIVFPTEGCWEVTGRAELTFVLRFVDEVTDRTGQARNAPGDCPVTIPNGDAPPRPAAPLNHGENGIWTSLPARGVAVAVAPGSKLTPDSVPGAMPVRGGAIELRFWLWSRRRAREPFTITGRLLGARGRPLAAEVRDPRATDFSSRLTFPRQGCWKITGRSGADALSFVVYLIDELRR